MYFQENGAAFEAGGLEVGQLILEVDGQKVEGKNFVKRRSYRVEGIKQWGNQVLQSMCGVRTTIKFPVIVTMIPVTYVHFICLGCI